MARLNEIVAHCNELLSVESIHDYCPNGLQVQGPENISTLVSGVTASAALIDAAIERNADALLVHHGYFWKGEDACLTGIKYQRIKKLIDHNIALIAYHLPLDMHSRLGNNAGLGKSLGFGGMKVVSDGEAKGLLWYCDLEESMSPDTLLGNIDHALNRKPLHIDSGVKEIKRVGWCTGGAQNYIDQAADLGCDAYISGEISEKTTHIAIERGVHYFAAGHHATERFGVSALAYYLHETFNIEQYFVDIDNPA